MIRRAAYLVLLAVGIMWAHSLHAQTKALVVVDASASMCGYYRGETAGGATSAFLQLFDHVQRALVTSDTQIEIFNLATTSAQDKVPLKRGEKSLRDYFRGGQCPFRGVTSELHKVLEHDGFEGADFTLVLSDVILTESDRIALGRTFKEWASRRQNRWLDVSVGLLGIKSEFTGKYYRELPSTAEQSSFELERHARPLYMIWFARNGEVANKLVSAIWRQVGAMRDIPSLLYVIAPLPGDGASLADKPSKLAIDAESITLTRLKSVGKPESASACIRGQQIGGGGTEVIATLGRGTLCKDLNDRFALSVELRGTMKGGGDVGIRVNGKPVSVLDLPKGAVRAPLPESRGDAQVRAYRSSGRYIVQFPIETRQERFVVETNFSILPGRDSKPDWIGVDLSNWSSSDDTCRRFPLCQYK